METVAGERGPTPSPDDPLWEPPERPRVQNHSGSLALRTAPTPVACEAYAFLPFDFFFFLAYSLAQSSDDG